MSILGKVVGAALDPGGLVKDAVNTLLPKDLAIVGDLAGVAVDVATNQPASAKHALDALKDLPQAAKFVGRLAGEGAGEAARSVNGHGGGWRGTPAFEPTRPPRGPQVNVTVNGGAVSVTVNNRPPGWHPSALGNFLAHAAPQPEHGGFFETMHAMIQQLLHQQGATPATSAPGSPSTGSTGSAGSTCGSPSASGGGGITSKDQIQSMSDADFMDAVRSGKISQDISKDPAAMVQIQERMNRITQMNQLMSQMMAAMHQMAMSTIQNIRA